MLSSLSATMALHSNRGSSGNLPSSMDSTLHSSKRSPTVVSTSNAFYSSPLPGLEDFNELFSFHSSSSIPVLDLAPSPRHDLDIRAPSTAFEYDDVFASLTEDCYALSYDELLQVFAGHHATEDEFPDRAASAVFDDAKDDSKKPCEPLHSSEESSLERESVYERNDAVAASDESLKKASGAERKQENDKKEEGEGRVTGKSVKARIAAFEQRFKKAEAVVSIQTKDNDEDEETKDDIILELFGNEVEKVQDKEGIERRCDDEEDEPPMRTQARLQRHKRVSDRAAQALAEKTKRDLIKEREAVERERVAESLDLEVKRWSSGKEGNLRALLSTLQYILGADGGWQAVPLTDIVAAAAVKKAYKKATLCLHPDKLQQRGASVHQKYTCEKVFDLLKDAWTIFNSEEW